MATVMSMFILILLWMKEQNVRAIMSNIYVMPLDTDKHT